MLAKREGRRYAGSTSSLTGMLSHIYFLISGFREINTSSLSRHFQNDVGLFTIILNPAYFVSFSEQSFYPWPKDARYSQAKLQRWSLRVRFSII
jgi:hypothetical protein